MSDSRDAAPPVSGGTSGGGWEDVSGLTLRAGFCRLSYGLAVLYLVAALVDAVALGVPGLVLSLVLVAASMSSAGLWHRRRPMSTPTLQSVSWLIVLGIVAVWTAHALVLGWPSFALLMAGTLLAAGSMLPGLRLFLLADLICVLGFGWAVSTRLDDPNWVLTGLSLLLGIVVAHILQVFTDTGRRQLQQLASELAAEAMRDPLTGLLNRQGLTETLRRRLPEVGDGREPALRKVAVLCFDINGFKAINDELGHSAGDGVLIELAARLRHLARTEDVLARTGGDEFVLLMIDATGNGAIRVRDHARLRLRGCAGVLQLPWSVSVGHAWADVRDEGQLLELQRTADVAMYEDKRAYRARLGAIDLSSGPAQSRP